MVRITTLVFALLFTSVANSSVILPSLKGGDLTDPENDASSTNYSGHNATYSASNKPYFTPGHGAFNVFDNEVGRGGDKWCCDGAPVWVEADFGSELYNLTSFTITSGNDVPGRDPDVWSIQGSTDGTNYFSIFDYVDDGTSPFTARLQTVEFSLGSDFFNPNAYSIFRYEATSVMQDGGFHQINELEFFGTEAAVPEPSIIALFGLGLAGIGFARRRQS
jgi:hypothetical protein